MEFHRLTPEESVDFQAKIDSGEAVRIHLMSIDAQLDYELIEIFRVLRERREAFVDYFSDPQYSDSISKEDANDAWHTMLAFLFKGGEEQI